MAVLLVASWSIFASAVAWPTLALIGQCVTGGAPPAEGYTFSSRQLGLLWRTAWLSVSAMVLALVISLPGAFMVGGAGRLRRHPLMAGMMLGLLLCPPAVYAFGWERILPSTFNPYARCILVWALWSWPIPALIIGTGWSRVGRSAYEAALMCAAPSEAFVRTALPALLRYITLSGLILFLLFFNDYGVPHACLLLVLATELLGKAESSSLPVDTVWPSLLPIAVTVLTLSAVFLAWQRCAGDEAGDGGRSAASSPSRTAAAVVTVCFVVSWLVPTGALVCKLSSARRIVEAFQTYRFDLAWSVAIALLAGVMSVVMGLGLALTRRGRLLFLLWAMAFGALPGALVGESLIAAYNHDVTWWIYDHWPVMALSFISRFGWMGMLTALVVVESCSPDLIAQARIDGADRSSILSRIQLPIGCSTLLCGAAIILALALAEVAASSLLRLPSFNPIAHVLMEKFHRFEDDMLISLSLWLTAAALPPTLLVMTALRRRR